LAAHNEKVTARFENIMNTNKDQILQKAKEWFRSTIIENHARNTQKLVNPNEFNINPFLSIYLANYLTGNSQPESIAKALVYPRVMSTSITTSFGTNIQKFASTVLDGFGSTTSGIDLEFIDQVDGRRKYCQLKAGPETINKDDVETIAGHFKGVIGLAKINGRKISFDDMVVGLIYGEQKQISSHYKRIESQYHFPVLAAPDFWHRLTGDAHFYQDLVAAIGSIATSSNYRDELDLVITTLSKHEDIIALSQAANSAKK
jgi:hypothetical protein